MSAKVKEGPQRVFVTQLNHLSLESSFCVNALVSFVDLTSNTDAKNRFSCCKGNILLFYNSPFLIQVCPLLGFSPLQHEYRGQYTFESMWIARPRIDVIIHLILHFWVSC